MHTHAHMHTCTHAHMHTCTHAHMHTVFARAGLPSMQRIQCLVFLPERMISIQPGTMRVHVVPDLPEHVENVLRQEQTTRGRVSYAGRSEVSTIELPKSALELTLTQLPPLKPNTQSKLWLGEVPIHRPQPTRLLVMLGNMSRARAEQGNSTFPHKCPHNRLSQRTVQSAARQRPRR